MYEPSFFMRDVDRVERNLRTSIECLVIPALDYHSLRQSGVEIDRKVTPMSGISRLMPLVTLGIATCNSLVLIGNDWFSLFHESSNVDPEVYLPGMIRAFRDLEPNFSAIQVGGDEKIHKEIREILDGERISVVNSYCDRWNVEDEPPIGLQKTSKNIFVYPTHRRVVMLKNRDEIKTQKVILYEE